MNDHEPACGETGDLVNQGLLRAALQNHVAGEGLFAAVAGVESALRKRPDGPFLLSGLHGGTGALLLAAWQVQSGRTGLVVTADRQSADQLADDLEVWLGPEVERLLL